MSQCKITKSLASFEFNLISIFGGKIWVVTSSPIYSAYIFAVGHGLIMFQSYLMSRQQSFVNETFFLENSNFYKLFVVNQFLYL